MVPRRKKTIWATDTLSATHKERAALLGAAGFDVEFVKGPSEFMRACELTRPGTIVIDTYGSSAETQRVIAMIANTPELAGARCVLSISRLDSEACKAAMSANFRDFIPWRIDAKLWMSRFQYAVSARPIELPAALGAITMNQPAVLRVPGRLVWMNETHVRLECRGHLKAGMSFHVAGPVAHAMGCQRISLTVEDVHKDRLIYRYSQAIVATWSVASDFTERAKALVRRVKSDSPGPRSRVFIAMNRVAWRKLAIDVLNPALFEVNVAMQRSNITSEFAYFSPDVVLFDDRVANNLSDVELLSMFSKIPSDIPLVIFGKDFQGTRIAAVLPGRPIFSEAELTSESLHGLLQKYRITSHASSAAEDQNTVHFMSDHPWSKLELEVTGRIKSLSPKGGTLGLPFSIGPFTLARIESPLLRKAMGRDLFIKMTSFRESEAATTQPQFNQESEFRLTDLDQDDSRKLAVNLIQTASDFYAKHYSYPAQLVTTGTLALKAAMTQGANAQKSLAIPTALPPAAAAVLPTEEPTLEDILTLPDVKASDPTDEEETRLERLHAENPDHKKVQAFPRTAKSRDKHLSFQLKDYVDPILVRALGLFIVAATLMGFVIHAAMNVDENSYKDRGKVYSEFFKRMKDAEYRKTNPASSVKRHSDSSENNGH